MQHFDKRMTVVESTGASTTGTIRKGCLRQFISRVNRKQIQQTHVMETNLRRCLSTLDMVALSIGIIAGSGIYVVTANAAKHQAGPSIVVSFLISGIAATLSALCYAELGAKFPRAGSVYSYAYLSLGEFWAFLIGWTMILAGIIACASVARSYSAYIDSLTGGIIKNRTEDFIGTGHGPFIAEYFDFFGVTILILFVILLSFGIRMASYVTNTLSVINVSALLLIICVGAYFSDTTNWTNPKTGGFAPFGWSGVLAASASCFYTYAGFESVCSLGEEAKNPQKSIPRSIIITMAIITTLFIGVSCVFTMMISYQDIVDDSGLLEAFAFHEAYWAKYAVVVGALCGMSTGLMMCILVISRLIYSMAEDGLLFPFLAVIDKKIQEPRRAVFVVSGLSALFTLVLDIDSQVELFVTGTLASYIIVNASVIILRYKPSSDIINKPKSPSIDGTEVNNIFTIDEAGQLKDRYQSLQNLLDYRPGHLVMACVLCLTTSIIITCIFIIQCFSSISSGAGWALCLLVILLICVVVSFTVVLFHQQSRTLETYKIPLAPFTPVLSLFVNVLLIINVSAITWLRLLVWIVIGLFVYFIYGIRHSKLAHGPPKISLAPSTCDTTLDS